LSLWSYSLLFKKYNLLSSRIGIALILFTASGCIQSEETTNTKNHHYTGHYTDSHVHTVDFMQEGESLNKLLKSMDQNNIDHSMIAGIGVMKKWAENEPQRPQYYLSDNSPVYWYSATDYQLMKQYTDLSPEQQSRLHPFIAGFNPTDIQSVDQVARLLKLYPQHWQGIGEIFTRHDDLSALTEGEIARANHPALLKIYKLAAKNDLPVMIHSNLTSKREDDWLYLPELEDALELSPKTRFIWAHAGTSGTLHRWQTHEKLHILIARLLEKHDNLWIDLSWSVLKPYIFQQANELQKNSDATNVNSNSTSAKKGDQPQVSQEWITLIEKFPHKFMIGSDVVGKYSSQGKLMHEFNPLLDKLKPATAHLVAKENFINILPHWAQP